MLAKAWLGNGWHAQVGALSTQIKSRGAALAGRSTSDDERLALKVIVRHFQCEVGGI